jgi:hypothetical protein
MTLHCRVSLGKKTSHEHLPPGTTSRLVRPKAPRTTKPNVPAAIGVQGIGHAKCPFRVVPHQSRGGGVQCEIVAPGGRHQRSNAVGVGCQHSLKRDTHGVHEIGLDALREGS